MTAPNRWVVEYEPNMRSNLQAARDGAEVSSIAPSVLWTTYDALTQISVSLAIVCSIANALSSGIDCQYAVGDIPSLAPSTAPIMESAQALEGDPQVDQAIVHAIHRLAMLLGFARNMTDVVGQAGSNELVPAIADSWTRAASACVVASILIERELPLGLLREPMAPALGIRRLLREVCGGAAPCIDSTGALRIPGWADRRAEHRCEIRKPVRIVVNGVEGTAMAHNVSTNGLRIAASFTLPVGAWVTVKTSDGLEVEGQVIWSDDEEAGLELARPIDPTQFINV